MYASELTVLLPIRHRLHLISSILLFQEIYTVLKDVATALKALHAANLVHGAVHPWNVLLTGNKGAVLAEYDFTKTLVSEQL